MLIRKRIIGTYLVIDYRNGWREIWTTMARALPPYTEFPLLARCYDRRGRKNEKFCP